MRGHKAEFALLQWVYIFLKKGPFYPWLAHFPFFALPDVMVPWFSCCWKPWLCFLFWVTSGDGRVLAKFKLLLLAAIGISFFLLHVKSAVLSQGGKTLGLASCWRLTHWEIMWLITAITQVPTWCIFWLGSLAQVLMPFWCVIAEQGLIQAKLCS